MVMLVNQGRVPLIVVIQTLVMLVLGGGPAIADAGRRGCSLDRAGLIGV